MLAIETNNLSKTFKSLEAVKNVTMSVGEGEIYGFLGPNGAGKTTTILMLATLLKPSSGSMKVFGKDPQVQASDVRKLIGYVPQDISLDEYLTAKENLVLQAKYYGINNKKAEEKANELLKLMELEDKASVQVGTFSGGQRKRLDLACGLVNSPKLLFLDEPTLGLDIHTRRKMWEYVRKLRDEQGITLFLTTHYLEEADSLCDRVAIIDHGEIKVVDTPASLKNALGEDTLSLKTESNAESVEKALKGVKAVKGVRAVGERLDVSVKNGEQNMSAILAALHKGNIGVQEVALKKPSLDDVFISYTGKELRDEE